MTYYIGIFMQVGSSFFQMSFLLPNNPDGSAPVMCLIGDVEASTEIVAEATEENDRDEEAL